MAEYLGKPDVKNGWQNFRDSIVTKFAFEKSAEIKEFRQGLLTGSGEHGKEMK